jgi:DNA-binding NarL/FixJ family response regulator
VNVTAYRVMVVDDHPVFRAGLAAILDAAPELTVVAEASTGLEAVDLAAQTHPDLVLMDLHMPDLGGVEATRRIVAHAPATKVLVLTMLDQDAAVAAALRAGARGYILKGADRAEVLRASRAVVAGDAVLSARVADRLPSILSATPSRGVAFPDLTVRENQILTLMARGRDNADIARELSLSLKTVRNYVSSILTKLQVPGRAQAIVKAREAGIAEASTT